MRISLQSQLVSLISLLIGLSIFSVIGLRYIALQNLQQNVNALSQANSEINHAKTMQVQWLTTLDIFLYDKQSYLAQGIDNQTKQLNKKYGEIALYANFDGSADEIVNLFTSINKGIQKLAFEKKIDEKSWNEFITLSDELTEQLLNLADVLSQSIKEKYGTKKLELTEAESQLASLALALLFIYLISTIAVSWWNSRTLVKPLEELSNLAKEGVKAKEDENPKLTIDKGPTEIRQLSESLESYSTNLKQQQRQTQKAHLEEQHTRQRLSTVMDTAPSAILSTDEKLNILTLNPATEKIFDLEAQVIINNSLLTLIPKLKESKNGFGTFKDFQAEANQENKTLPIEINSARLTQDGKKQYLFMIKDVSERKAQEKEMLSLNEQLVQSEKLASIGQLSAGVAHEINNPIGFIKSNLSLLNDYFDSFKEYINAIDTLSNVTTIEDTKQQLVELNHLKDKLDINFLMEDSEEIFVSSKDGLERVCKIVDEMKAFSHAEKDEQQAEDISNVIDQAISLTSNDVKYKADVQTNYGKLPFIKCWRTKLLQVFINLLVNASHAMKDKGFINIKTYQQDNYVRIEVLDNGCGISDENQKNIFTPFFTTKPVGQGTGLGLHVTQSIIAKHNGKIIVKSKLDKGTCFIILLPMEGVIT